MASFMKSQMEIRAERNAAKAEQAYGELASSVSPRSRALPHAYVGDVEQAEKAIRTCLKYIGVNPGAVPVGISDQGELIEWLCKPSGTMHRMVELKDGWQKEAVGAMFGHLKTGEPVALMPDGIWGYCYLDPVTGEKVKITNETASLIDVEAIFFYRPLPPREITDGDLKSFAFDILGKRDCLAVVAAALVVTVVGLFPAWANKIAFGVVAPSGQARLILPIAALLIGVVVSVALIEICRDLVTTRLSLKLELAAESAFYARLLSLPTGFFKDYASGELADRLKSVRKLCRRMIAIVFGSGLSTVLALVYVFQISAFTPALTVPALIVIVVQLVVGIVPTIVNIRYERRAKEAYANVSGVVTALLNGIQKIKLAGAEDLAFAKWARGYSAYAKAAYNRPAILYALEPLEAFVALLGIMYIFYAAATAHVPYDDFMAFSVAFGQISGALMALVKATRQIAEAKPMRDMIEPILRAVPEVDDSRPSVESLNGAIDVSGVTFRYDENQLFLFWNLSFSIKPGEYVALVGESGCGKSTIMRLLLGFEEPVTGSIFFGPYDVRDVNLRSLRQHIGTVTQNGKLFMGDIYSNIVISTPNATPQDVWEAAEIAGIADDIRKMPMGMRTLVRERAAGLSGGQRQRIMIARAVCGKPSILMFDEATSALDNITQKHISDSLAKLNCTRVVIAHRLSTVRECDRILVVGNGGIVEEGTYDELVARGGRFAELVARQRIEEGE